MAETQNTPIVIGNTLPTSIKSAHIAELMNFCKATGYSLSSILDRAIDNFMHVEAPVYLELAKQNQQA